ncbi:MAG: radical SAM protein [Proteobacteria bacterium]|nr:radical SAM protein [Pseudomonadota bacterium]
MKDWITGVVANAKGEIFELEGYAAVGMADTLLIPLTKKNTVAMPFGGELMLLPGRRPILFDMETGQLEVVAENPYEPGTPLFPVAVFNSPGYFNTLISAYHEDAGAEHLPLFSYGAVGWHGNSFRTANILVDSEDRQDLRLMKREDVMKGVQKIREKMPFNRLREHLEKCALTYGCPAGKNFFLSRYEAPLPTSTVCNADCLGCISLQAHPEIKCSQDRIDFTPLPEEIAQVALYHMEQVSRPVVSFGQGCEGDPLLAAHAIIPAMGLIREKTEKGTINMNTNGSRPDVLKKMLAAGLDSVRISLNSVRENCYTAYFRPKKYDFSHVLESIDLALTLKKFVSINYLNCPGFTDTPQEFEALCQFLKKYPVNMIQWRNLNFDPKRYWAVMEGLEPHGMPLGMKKIFNRLKKDFPALRHGYFNPPKETFPGLT